MPYASNGPVSLYYETFGAPENPALLMINGLGSQAINVPALVLHGDADKLIDASGGRRTAACIPGARLEVIEGMGHDYPPIYWNRWVELITCHAGMTVSSKKEGAAS